MTKVAIFARDVIGTGGGTVALEMVMGLNSRGFHIVLVTDYPVQEYVDDRIEKFSMPLGNLLYGWRPKSKILKRLRHFAQLLAFSIYGRWMLFRLKRRGYLTIDHNLEAFGGEIAIMHNIFLHQFISDNRKFIRKIVQLINPIFWFRIFREIICLQCGLVKVAVAVSASSVAEVVSVSSQKLDVQCIPNGINTEKFKILLPEEIKSIKNKYGASNRFVILFVGHEFQRKRLDLALEALALLPEYFALWVVGGRVDDIEKLRCSVFARSASSRIQFLGTLDNPAQVMAAADCFLLPSDYETWGMVVLEALACGTPVIMTDVGCARAVIKQGINGYISDSNPTALAKYVKKIADEKNISRKICRQSVNEFAWSTSIDKYANLIESIAKKETRDI